LISFTEKFKNELKKKKIGILKFYQTALTALAYGVNVFATPYSKCKKVKVDAPYFKTMSNNKPCVNDIQITSQA
jgi:hypothetical protein